MGLKSINSFDGGEANNRNKPDVVLMEEKEGKCLIIDIARPFDTRISEEKLEKYQDLKRELKRIWNKKPLGALGMVSSSLRKWLQVLDVAKELWLLQMLCLWEQLACGHRRISGRRFSQPISVKRNDDRKYVCDRRLGNTRDP